MHLGFGEGGPAQFEEGGFHEVGGDWGVVAGLLHVHGDAGDAALEGLAQGGVEWLCGFGLE